MRRALPAVVAIAVLVMACGGPSGSPTGSPVSAGPTPKPTPNPAFVEARSDGITIKTGDSGTANLTGGKYRIGWNAPGCTMLGIQVGLAAGDTIGVDVHLPSGEATLDLPAGKAVLNRVADCDYTVRFETVP